MVFVIVAFPTVTLTAEALVTAVVVVFAPVAVMFRLVILAALLDMFSG